MSTAYFECQATSLEKATLYKEAKTVIGHLSEHETLQKLEQIVNECKGEIMVKIRQQLPELRETDIQLLLYCCVGFSVRAISSFMQDKPANIYNRKFRLKSKIANSTAPDKDAFIHLLTQP